MHTRAVTQQEIELDEAATEGDIKKVKELITAGVNVNCLIPWDERIELTPLMRASQYGHENVVRALIDADANIHYKPKSKHTALHLAAQFGRWRIVNILLAQGAHVNEKNELGSALNSASICGDYEIADRMFPMGETKIIPVDNAFITKHSPIPVTHRTLKTIKILISGGAEVTQAILDQAVRLGRIRAVDVMLEEMAKKAIKDQSVADCLTYWDRLIQQLQSTPQLNRPSAEVIKGTLDVIIQGINYFYTKTLYLYEPIVSILNEFCHCKIYNSNKSLRADVRSAFAAALEKKIKAIIKEKDLEELNDKLNELAYIRCVLEPIQGKSRFTDEKTAMTMVKRLITDLEKAIKTLTPVSDIADEDAAIENEQEAHDSTETKVESETDDSTESEVESKTMQPTPASILSTSPQTLFAAKDFDPAFLDALSRSIASGNIHYLKDKIASTNHPADLLKKRVTTYQENGVYFEKDKAIAIPFAHNPGHYKYSKKTLLQILLMNAEFEKAIQIGVHLTPQEREDQFLEIFPDKEIITYDFKLEDAEALLKTVFEALSNDTGISGNNLDRMSEATREALTQLQAYAKPTHKKNAGLVFDPAFYASALALRNSEEAKALFTADKAKEFFWLVRVEEWLAACLGSRYLRAHAHGVSIKINHENCELADGSKYHLYGRTMDSIPGFNCYIDIFGEAHNTLPTNTMGDSIRIRAADLFFKIMAKVDEAGEDMREKFLQTQNNQPRR